MSCRVVNDQPDCVHFRLGQRTENSGGTEASFPVLFSSVEMGNIKSAFLAGGCLADEAKNVALTVA